MEIITNRCAYCESKRHFVKNCFIYTQVDRDKYISKKAARERRFTNCGLELNKYPCHKVCFKDIPVLKL